MQVRFRAGSRYRHGSGGHFCRRAQAAERDCRKISHQGSSLIMSLLVVGSVAFDAVETPFGKVDRMLGGAATYFAVAASFFTHVNLVGIVGEDFTDKDASIFPSARSSPSVSTRRASSGLREKHFSGPGVTTK